MALTGYERVKRWREKNRALYNLRRRNGRKWRKFAGSRMDELGRCGVAPERLTDKPVQTSKVETLDNLRSLVRQEEEKPAVEVPEVSGRPIVYRNDYGGVISKFAWEKLQKLKEEAKRNNYELDEYSQGVK